MAKCKEAAGGTELNREYCEEAGIEARQVTMHDNNPVVVIRISNGKGLILELTNYGSRILNLFAPDKNGVRDDVAVGYDDVEKYIASSKYFGCTVGRYANRIRGGSFVLNHKQYQLTQNEGMNHLHGGNKGFDKYCWQWAKMETDNWYTVEFFRRSPDGEEGYPGNLDVVVRYNLAKHKNEFQIEYHACTDKDTIINLTNHTFFNLGGGNRNTVLDHELQINADSYLPVDSELIPTGELREVKGTHMDFTGRKTIADNMHVEEQLTGERNGYDHCYVLRNAKNTKHPACRLIEAQSGRIMEIWTTEPGIQLYTGNYFDGTIKGKNNTYLTKHCSLCLEPQHFPDTPNNPSFPSTCVRAGEEFTSCTRYELKTVIPS